MPKLDSDLLEAKLASLVCVFAICACAAKTAGPTSAQGKAAINDSLSAQQLHDRIRAWILSVNDARDLSEPNIEKRTGLDLGPDSEQPNGFRGVGALPEGWRYSLSSVKTVPGPSPHSVLFHMGRISESYADMTPVCVELEHYRSALIAAGFKPSQRPQRLGTEYRFFRTKKVSVRVETHGKTKRYDEQRCVSRLFVSAAPPPG